MGGLGFLCRVGDGIICREEGRFEERGGSGRCFASSGMVGGGGQRAETSQWPWAAMGAHGSRQPWRAFLPAPCAPWEKVGDGVIQSLLRARQELRVWHVGMSGESLS